MYMYLNASFSCTKTLYHFYFDIDTAKNTKINKTRPRFNYHFNFDFDVARKQTVYLRNIYVIKGVYV